jgi:hypothetical protein
VVEVELARDLVQRLAPEEQELFGVISTAYQRDPDRFAQPGRGRDEMLGFGIETAATLLTPVLLAALGDVMKYLAGELGEAIGVRGWFRRRFGRKPAAATAPAPATLDAAQLARVRQIVLDKCRQAELPDARAQLVADGVVGALTAGG